MTVELAFVVTFLSILVLGICEMGRALNAEAVLSETVRKACVVGSRPGCGNSSIASEVQNGLNAAGLPGGEAQITILVNDKPGNVAYASANDKITVSVMIPFALISITGSNLFMGEGMNQTQSMTVLKQG